MFEPLVILFIIKNLLICNGLFFLFSIVESLTFLPIFSVFVKIPDVLTFIKCKEFLERITVKASLNVFPYFSYFNKCVSRIFVLIYLPEILKVLHVTRLI